MTVGNVEGGRVAIEVIIEFFIKHIKLQLLGTWLGESGEFNKG